MMIYSMTAFSRIHHQGEWGQLICEMRSINHRYCEMSLHIPEAFRVFEMPMREMIRQHVQRGKIECMMRFQPNAAAEGSLAVNTNLVRELGVASEKIAALLPNTGSVSPFDILRFPGVHENQNTDNKKLQTEVMQILQQALAELLVVRGREGEELKQLFLQRMDLILSELAKIRERLPQVLVEQREKLLKRFTEAKLELEAGRLEQEMVFFAQKMDVAEEVDRIETHVAEVRRVLKQGGLAGRRLDFILQELNREANTLGSKSLDAGLIHAAVEMKVLIEQVREQVQNVE
jgi:uncharacterized protein (TIGR00255 family)